AGKTTVENNSLSGDQLRESYKESAKWWKDQTRETFGEGTTSTAINSVIGALEDAGDLAIAGGDYVLDGAAAVTACATASNYCQKALNDLEGKHQGALGVATSLINGDSWNAIQDLAKRAGEGDQLAAEQLGAAMAGVFIPGKKVPTPVTGEKIPGKLPEGSNWTAGEGAFSPNNGKGTVTDVVKGDAKYDGNSLPYGKETPPKIENSTETNVGSGKLKDSQIWTDTKKTDPVSNAYGHWDKHKSEFPEFQNSKQYVDATHNFVNSPPKGTLIKERPNGDTMYYNQSTNTFAVKNADGTPKTMFRPQNGIEYWEKQK
ncbi:hypothetical protein ABJA24_004174, partial [Providencia rettgeri]